MDGDRPQPLSHSNTMSSPASSNRALKRKPTNDSFHYASDWLCIWSDAIAPVPVGPPETYEGVRSVLVGSNVRWLKKLCFRHSAFQSDEAHFIHQAIHDLRAKLSGEAQEASVQDVGAAALVEGHSSQEEESADQGAPREARIP